MISEIDPTAGKELGQIQNTGGDIVAMVGYEGNLFAANAGGNDVEQIDPARLAVTSEASVQDPSGLAVADDRLWVSSAAGGWFTQVYPARRYKTARRVSCHPESTRARCPTASARTRPTLAP